MKSYCIARKKPFRCEKTEPQMAMIIFVFGFTICLSVLNLIVIGQYTIDRIQY